MCSRVEAIERLTNDTFFLKPERAWNERERINSGDVDDPFDDQALDWTVDGYYEGPSHEGPIAD